ncbi:MAG: thermonuclease family protein [Nitrospira sp.]|nr:thermonuclease family protein [Nitrospira sp.]MDH4369463.1 thermonuclease family protein [Nitrospira sp.]MDH5346743.1 thermonuclease family protein [Nitrospira sp.]MDH5496387.1 thermonuclease family protein [Nitrospira sp.]MDH5724492.1 thermonuclease family protein [Nitrospira sp.]
MKTRVLPLVLVFLLSAADALSFGGEVVGVLEGSTIEVGRLGKTALIRLDGLDCPEKDQPYGDEVKPAISALVFAMEVTVEPHGKDKYGRIMADVLLADGTNVNHALVKEGRCWWSRRSAPNNAELERLELEAREAKKGLWEDPEPIPPWEFRKAQRRRSPGAQKN